MNGGRREIALLLAGLLLGVGVAYILFAPSRPPRVAPTPPPGSSCATSTEIRELSDANMAGEIEPGSKYEAILNYYACNLPEVGDIVLYQIARGADPVVRVVHAVEGDHFEVRKNTGGLGWTLKVNGKMVKYSGGNYYFGGTMVPALGLYEKANAGVLKKGDAIILSVVPPGGMDSGFFGVVNQVDFAGKVGKVLGKDAAVTATPAPAATPEAAPVAAPAAAPVPAPKSSPGAGGAKGTGPAHPKKPPVKAK